MGFLWMTVRLSDESLIHGFAVVEAQHVIMSLVQPDAASLEASIGGITQEET